MIDNKRHKKALFVFRSDLCLNNNTELLNALKLSETVIPLLAVLNRTKAPIL
jgi:hypothetical protein